jgi:hypothetical protein
MGMRSKSMGEAFKAGKGNSGLHNLPDDPKAPPPPPGGGGGGMRTPMSSGSSNQGQGQGHTGQAPLLKRKSDY